MIHKQQTTSRDPAFLEDASLPWAVDMDGTLIAQDVTEVARDISFVTPHYWLLCLVCLILYFSRLSRITAYRLWERFVQIDPSKLDYNQRLLQHVSRHRRRGGLVTLASASHVHITRIVANYVEELIEKSSSAQTLRLFEDVIGRYPPKTWNAAGLVKARLIEERFPTGFVYAGNSTEDLEVWQHPACLAMILVNCPPDVLQQAKQIAKPFVVL